MSIPFIIAVDFDGTLCDHRFPEIGMENPGAFRWLRQFQSEGALLVLWTMRSDQRSVGTSPEGHKAERDFLAEAVAWCQERGVEFWGINQNPDQRTWTDSPKAYAQLYIDDAAVGCPMRVCPRSGAKPWVNWDVVGPMVLELMQGRAS